MAQQSQRGIWDGRPPKDDILKARMSWVNKNRFDQLMTRLDRHRRYPDYEAFIMDMVTYIEADESRFIETIRSNQAGAHAAL